MDMEKNVESKQNGVNEPITPRIRSFYEHYPYPAQRVVGQADLTRGEHARMMKKILATVSLAPQDLRGLRVLDAGCGTGEKSLYCAIMGAQADAFDLSKTSISIARKNAALFRMKNVSYRVADFANVRLEKKYDLILAMGSLHHSEEPKGNFMRLARALKPGGHIVVGLYNLYGRLACRIERKMIRLRLGPLAENNDATSIDESARIVRSLPPSKSPTHLASLADRYATPHESYHTVEEVLGWFREAGMEAAGTDPPVNIASRADPLVKQLGWMIQKKGFFCIGARKK